MVSASKIRGGLRSQVTQEWNKVKGMIDGSLAANLQQLEISLSKIEDYQLKINEKDERVLDETADDQLDAEIAETISYNDNVMECIENLKWMIRESQRGAAAPAQPQDVAAMISAALGAARTTGGGSAQRPTIHLPKLEMKKFCGDVLQWIPFWDFYKTAVHENAALSKIEKFNYLVSTCLAGEAYSLAAGYSLTDANYEQVIEALHERYGNPQRARFAHFDALFEMKQGRDDLSDLQRVYDDCEKHIRSLKALGSNENWEDVMNEMFVRLILNKLPSRVKTDLCRRTGAQDWTLENLRENLRVEISARDMGKSSPAVEQRGAPGGRDCKQLQQHRGFQDSRVTTTSSLVSNSTHHNSEGRQCFFCGRSNHFSDECRTHATLDSRKGVCFACLGARHAARSCRRRKACNYCHRDSHHRSLCPERYGQNPGGRGPSFAEASRPNRSTGQGQPRRSPVKPETSAVCVQEDRKVVRKTAFLQTALCTMQGQRKAEGRVLLDTASSCSFVTEEFCKKLGLQILLKDFHSVGVFGTKRRKNDQAKLVRFSVVCSSGELIEVVAALTPAISHPVYRLPIDDDRYPVVANLTLADPPSGNPVGEELELDVLIGADYYYAFIQPGYIIPCNGLVLVPSKLGFLTSGAVPDDQSGSKNVLVLLRPEATSEWRGSDCAEEMDIRKFWEIEDAGQREKCVDVSDESALRQFEQNVVFENGRYAVSWPWKTTTPELPDNFKLAHARLNVLYGRLKQNPELMLAYHDIITKQKAVGVIEEAPKRPDGIMYYMPHHCVVTPGKSTKVRIVYDASSKLKKEFPSLNDCLHRGPVILDDMCGLLLQFRCKRIALVSDIEKAFLQLTLQKQDRDVARFLWVKDPAKPPTGENLVIYRFARVFFGAIASPFLLAATISTHLKKAGTEVAESIREHLYVDNVIAGEDSEEKAVQHYHESKRIFESASMNLREFYTNSNCVREKIDEADRGKGNEPKVLGIRWNTNRDTLACTGMKQESGRVDRLTKRVIVRRVAQMFDPCGWLSPLTISGKLLVQECWRRGIDWDEVVPPDLKLKFDKVTSEMERMSEIQIKRYADVGPNERYQLHTFCDASGKASACAVYLRKEGTNRLVSCDLLFSKSRLAPVESKQTIPRLELIGLEMGSKVSEFVRNHLRLPLEVEVLWTDSKCVLHWLRKDKLETKFVQRRVKEIVSRKQQKFRYVPTADNPADLPTRGMGVEELQRSDLWWHGPRWLLQTENYWPDQKELSHWQAPEEHERDTVTTAAVATVAVAQQLLDPGRFSSLQKLLRVTAYVKRFVDNARKLRGSRQSGAMLSLTEIADARKYWEIQTQKASFPGLFSGCSKTFERAMKKLSPLRIYRDKQCGGILRCSGRLEKSGLPYDTQNPILLPKGHYLTQLVIEHVHKNNLHAGVSQTLAAVRQAYWIVQGRSQVKQVIRKCAVCRRQDGGPYSIPPAPALPDFRTSGQVPFAHTGLDYLGPLFIKSKDGTKNKVWICLFTCALTRAVHLEVVQNQSAAEFQLALRRFFAAFGAPVLIVSDNASQFHTVDSAIQRMQKQVSTDLEEFSALQGVGWKYIPEMSPWMGGFYERLVGVVKKHLKKTLQGLCVTVSELETVVAEIAYVVNSRPLLYVGDSPEDLQLSPNDLLGKTRRSGLMTFPNGNGPVGQSTVQQVVANWKRIQAVSTHFWDVWRQAYLTSLREKHRSVSDRNCSHIHPAVGSVVLIKDKMPRAMWKLGRIERLNPGSDGKVRTVDVRLTNGRSVVRPIKLLYPLEVEVESAQSNNCITEGHSESQANFQGFSAADVRETSDLLNAYRKLERNYSNVNQLEA